MLNHVLYATPVCHCQERFGNTTQKKSCRSHGNENVSIYTLSTNFNRIKTALNMNTLLFILVPMGMLFFWLVTVVYMCHCTSTNSRDDAEHSAEPEFVAGSDSDTSSRFPNTESEALPGPATETPQPPPGSPRTANMVISQGRRQNRRGVRRGVGNLLRTGQPTASRFYIPPKSPSTSSSTSSSSWEWGSTPAFGNLLDTTARPRSSPRAGSETTDYQPGRSPEEPIPIFHLSL